jgi:hypothetical protein
MVKIGYSDFLLLGKEIQLLKDGFQVGRSLEKPAFFALTSANFSLFYSNPSRTESVTTYDLKKLHNIRRVVNSGVFSMLEFIMTDGSGICFRFESEESQREVSRKLVRMRKLKTEEGKTHAPNLIYDKTLNPVNLFQINMFTSRWVNHQLSTMDYLMAVNTLASRTGYEFQRHAIFPNVISNYGSQKPTVQGGTLFNKFSKSLLSGTITIKPEESSLWETGIPVNFLERKHPYLEIIGEGGHFESCIEIKNANPKPTELIPEFFSEPSFLLGNKWKNPVTLPRFSADPFSFIVMHRRFLESEEVAEWLGKWIDSSFGVESRALEVTQNQTSESTMQMTTQENPDLRHLKLLCDIHPKRKSRQELRKKQFFDPTHTVTFFEPYSRLSERDLLHLSTSLSSNKVAFITKSRLLVYDSAIQYKSESKPDSQGLYIVQEASLAPDCMAQMASPFQYLWSKNLLLGAHRSVLGSLAIYDVVAENLCSLTLSVRAISQIRVLPHTGDVLVGSLEGAISVVDFSRSIPQIIYSYFLDNLPVTGQVILSYPRSAWHTHQRTLPWRSLSSTDRASWSQTA